MSKKNLMISSGKISEEDKSWDIKFWQSVSTAERFKAASELIRLAYKTRTGKELSNSIDKTVIESGSYIND
jgi:hypothetical protein